MDFIYELFNLLIFSIFVLISSVFVIVTKKPLAIIIPLFISIAIYSISYNGLLAGLSMIILTLILKFV